jgi:hypothetical protein
MTALMNTVNTAAGLALAMKDAGCRICTITYRKVGKEVGRAPNKQRVGDDLIRQQFLSGVSYVNLKQRDLVTLDTLDAASFLAANPVVGGFTMDAATVAAAIAETRESTVLTINGENESTTDDAYEPFLYDGSPVKGGKVYCGQNPEIVQGTLYLWGLRLQTEIIERGNPVPPRKFREALTACKDAVRRLLPSSRFVSYRLAPEHMERLKVAGVEAVVTASAATATGTDDGGEE